MLRTAVFLLTTVLAAGPTVAAAADDARGGVSVDTKVLTNAKVERNGKVVGTVQRVMVNPTSGRISHVDILMTEGQSRTVSVPWSGLQVYQDHGGNMTLSLTSRAAIEASPSASPRMADVQPPVANDVTTSQRRLKALGYDPGSVDGVMGPGTRAALRAYQRDHGLRTTGQLDTPTVRNLNRQMSAVSTPEPSAPVTMDIRAAQRELSARGYYAGALDGVIGPGTRAALMAYQRDHGLPRTGRLDARTARTLIGETPQSG